MKNKIVICLIALAGYFQICARPDEGVELLPENRIANASTKNAGQLSNAVKASEFSAAHEIKSSVISSLSGDLVAKVDVDSGAITKISPNIGNPADITLALSKVLEAKGLKALDYNETSALASALKDVKKCALLPEVDQKPYIDSFNHVLRDILSQRKTNLSLTELNTMLTTKNVSSLSSLKVLFSHAVTNLTGSKIDPKSLVEKNTNHKNVTLSAPEKTQRIDALKKTAEFLEQQPNFGFEDISTEEKKPDNKELARSFKARAIAEEAPQSIVDEKIRLREQQIAHQKIEAAPVRMGNSAYQIKPQKPLRKIEKQATQLQDAGDLVQFAAKGEKYQEAAQRFNRGAGTLDWEPGTRQEVAQPRQAAAKKYKPSPLSKPSAVEQKQSGFEAIS